jgi:hypothetical protein
MDGEARDEVARDAERRRLHATVEASGRQYRRSSGVGASPVQANRRRREAEGDGRYTTGPDRVYKNDGRGVSVK